MKQSLPVAFLKFLNTHKSAILFVVVLLLAVALRFWRYSDRWGLAYDQAHDVLVARYAIEHFKLPLVGPFSSAGPFQTGGEWYWFIMGALMQGMNHVITPWIILTLIYVVFVLILIRVAEELFGKSFGIIAGLLAAVSTAQLSQGVNLTNQAPESFIALLAIWSSIRFLKTKRSVYVFFLAFFCSLGMTVHLQAAALLVFIGTTMLAVWPWNFQTFIVMTIGLFVPFIPLLWYDAMHRFFNIGNMIRYIFFNPNKIPYEALGRRWLTYITVYWPNEWSNIVGGYKLIAMAVICCILVMIVYAIIRKQIKKSIVLLFVSFILMVALIRYVRTPLYSSYLMFLHPFIFLISAWSVKRLIKLNKYVGILLLAVVIAASLIRDIQEIHTAKNGMDQLANVWIARLTAKYPNATFRIYDYKRDHTGLSYPLVLYLETAKKISTTGIKVGLTVYRHESEIDNPIISGELQTFQLVDVSSSSSASLAKNGWVEISPEQVYKSTEEWQ